MKGIPSIKAVRQSLLGVALVFLAPQASLPQGAYLTQAEIRDTLEGHTLIGRDWAEFYLSDGSIRGRARAFGFVRSYTGTWSVPDNKVCYEYEVKSQNTCSRLKREGNTVYHFTVDGAAKTDGVAKRFDGDNLRSF